MVECSELRAYRSLIQAAPQPFLDAHGLGARPIGTAVAVVAQSITTTLNMNRVIGLGVEAPATEAMVEEIVQLYGGRALSFGVEVGPQARPGELVDWLRARRLRRGVATAMHYRAAAAIAGHAAPVKVVRASGAERKIVADICCEVFRMPPPAHALIANTAELPQWRQWLALADGQPIAAALSYVSDGAAWLGWDATLPAFRGRGAQAALIVERVNDAARAGCRYVTTETAVNVPNPDASFRNYARLGFSQAYERFTYIGLRTAQKVPANAT